MTPIQQSILNPFVEQSIKTLADMVHMDATAGDAFEDDVEKFRFKGYAIAAPTRGKIKGTILMHHYVETTVAIGNKLLSESFGEEMDVPAEDEDLADAIDEWCNTAVGLATEGLRVSGLSIEFDAPYFIQNTEAIDDLLENVTEVLTVPISIDGVGRFYFNYLLEESTTQEDTKESPSLETAAKKSEPVMDEKKTEISKESKILIVDDTRLNRRQLKRFLGKMGYENVVEAENGNQAIELTESESPDFLFLDIVMPECNGIDALREIRKSKPDLPVVMLTSISDSEKIDQCREQTIEGYIAKPITNDNYHEKLSVYIA